MPDELSSSHLWRFASQFRNRLVAATFAEPARLPHDKWNELQRIFTRLQFVQSRKWPVARESALVDASNTLDSLLRRLEECRKSLSIAEPAMIVAVSDIFADLRALPNEFSNLEVKLRERKVSVITDEIELEGVLLGRFQILLDLSELGTSQPYSVTALDPRPAAGDGDLTHPHVRGNRLCEGEGKVAIHNALQQGRLFDFFLLVRQILETYNSDSAYTSLSNWESRACSDCGRGTYEDESTSCDRCRDHICFDCSSRCEQCDSYCCSTCCTSCTECSDTLCNQCIECCPDCDSPYCSKCLSEPTCSTCQSHQESEPDDRSESNTTTPETEAGAPTAVHAVGLGEAALHA